MPAGWSRRPAPPMGRIDTLVNNAALNYYIPTADYPTNRWIKAFAVNVHAPFILAKAVLPDMIAAGRGAIVNISSGSAIGPGRGPYKDQTVRGGVMYGASKAALERFTQGLAQEVAQHGGIAVELRVAVARRADAGHGLSQAGRRPRRSARRAALDDGARGAAAGERAGGEGERPRHLQPADPQGIRLDRQQASAAASMPSAAATRRSEGGVAMKEAVSVAPSAYEVRRARRPGLHIGLCSCRSCRKAHAAAFQRLRRYTLAARQLPLAARRGQNEHLQDRSPGKNRHFCSVCGSTAHRRASRRDPIVPAACRRLLDDDPGVAAGRAHLFLAPAGPACVRLGRAGHAARYEEWATGPRPHRSGRRKRNVTARPPLVWKVTSTTSSSAPARPAACWPTGCRPTRNRACCCSRRAARTTGSGSTSRSATSSPSAIRAPTGCSRPRPSRA